MARPDEYRQAQSSLRILLVSSSYPADTTFGAGQRTTFMYESLKALGEVVSLVLIEGQGLAVRRDVKAPVVAEITYPPRSALRKYSVVPEIASHVADIAPLDSFDIVVGRHPPPLFALGPIPGASLLDADDAYYRHPRGRTPILGNAWAGLKDRLRLQLNRQKLASVDHLWLSCERDRAALGLPSSTILPNVVPVDAGPVPPRRQGDPTILFVGALWYAPNREAVEWLLRECWPRIRSRHPTAKFRVIGAAPPEQRRRWEQAPGVECPGFVDDLAQEYSRAACALAPIQAGGGTQIKTLEALAHGRVPVVSSFVAGGFDPHFAHEKSILVADSSDQMVSLVDRLIAEPSWGDGIAAAGREVVRRVFSREQFDRAVRDAVLSCRTSAARRRAR